MLLLTPTATSVAASGNRARHAVTAVLMQLLVSLSYSYSVFRVPLATLHGWSKAQTIAPYRYLVLMISVGSIIGGAWQDRKGGRIVASAGGCLIGAGCLLAAVFGDTVSGLLLTFGIPVGLGIGLAYVTPIANLLKWFPDKRGMVVGLAVMGSGLSALFWGPLVELLIGGDPARFHETVPRTFVIMALIFSAAVIGIAQLYRLPPAGWKPEGWNPPPGVHLGYSLSPGEMFATKQFWILYATYLLGSSVGLTIIGQAAPLLQDIGMAGAPISAGVALGVLGLFNAFGRLSWGSLSDRMGRRKTLLAMGLVSIVACFGFLRQASGFWPAMAGICFAAFAYAGYLALMPAMTADYFGPKNVGANYGILFSAWGIAGFVVPGYFEGILDRAREAGNLLAGYREVYLDMAILGMLVLCLTPLLRHPKASATPN
jgi:OFA family oxalate/formate antiporter-like MFS transporter